MSTRQELIKEIEAFLKEMGTTRTAFGEKAMGDRTLMISLHAGRDPKSSTVDKIRAYMADERKKAAKRKPDPKAAHERAAA